MGLPFLDKDDFLERAFDEHVSVDSDLRQELSRRSDEAMAAEAMALGAGVLISFWRPVDRIVAYGTPTDWLSQGKVPVVELHCRCDPHTAQQRFVSRTRHAGHNDALRLDGLERQFRDLASLGPLGLWPVATIDTSNLDDAAGLGGEAVRNIRKLLI